MKSAGNIMRVQIELEDTDPKVWRQVDVPADTTLRDLHDVIQVAMGWDDDHMHAFQRKRDEMKQSGTLAGLFARGVKRFTYVYDFGDSWTHDIKLQHRLEEEPGAGYPRLVDGAGRCPPEDVGGTWGYYGLLEAWADPTHEAHDIAREWFGDEPIDPAVFDRAPVDAQFAAMANHAAKTRRRGNK